MEATDGLAECVTEQQIADAKAVIGKCGIGCEPASAASLAGIRKLTAAGKISPEDDVVAVLTGHLLKDPDYVYHYHTGGLKAPGGRALSSTFGNEPLVVPNDPGKMPRSSTRAANPKKKGPDGGGRRNLTERR